MRNILDRHIIVSLAAGWFLALSASPAVSQDHSAGQLANRELSTWRDSAPTNARFVEVEKGIKLEILDWGGTGRPVILLAGLGNTAHVFDSFAPRLTPKYHVYGITRRGYGASSAPASGYSADRLGDDVLVVLDALGLSRPVLIGHSIAGEELSSIGTRHPNRVAGLIYLDASSYYAYQSDQSNEMKIAVDKLVSRVGPLAFVEPTAADLANFAAFQLWTWMGRGVVFPEAELRETFESDRSGRITKSRTAEFVPQAILAGEQRFSQIEAPVLALFSIPHSYGRDFGKADPAAAARYIADEERVFTAQADAFERGNPAAHVVRFANANHYQFLSNAEDVVREADAFIGRLPK